MTANIKDHVLAIIAAETEEGLDTSTGQSFPGGEKNTASNLTEFGLFHSKEGVDLRFRGINTETPATLEIKYSDDGETLLINNLGGGGGAGLQPNYLVGPVIQTTAEVGPLQMVADEAEIHITAASERVVLQGGDAPLYLGGGDGGVQINGEGESVTIGGGGGGVAIAGNGGPVGIYGDAGGLTLTGGGGGVYVSGGSDGVTIVTNGGFVFTGQSPEVWEHNSTVEETWDAPVVEFYGATYENTYSGPVAVENLASYIWTATGSVDINVGAGFGFNLSGPSVKFDEGTEGLEIQYRGPGVSPGIWASDELSLGAGSDVIIRADSTDGRINVQTGIDGASTVNDGAVELNAGEITYGRGLPIQGNDLGGLLRLVSTYNGNPDPYVVLRSQVIGDPGFALTAPVTAELSAYNSFEGDVDTFVESTIAGTGVAGDLANLRVFAQNISTAGGRALLRVGADVTNLAAPEDCEVRLTSSGIMTLSADDLLSFNSSNLSTPVLLTDGTATELNTTAKSIIEAINELQSGGGGGGEANTASNVGGAAGLFKQKTGVDLEFRSVLGGTGLTATQNTDDVTVDLDDTAVTPGSYTSANITVDQQGRITAAADGPTPLDGPSGSAYDWDTVTTSGVYRGNGSTTNRPTGFNGFESVFVYTVLSGSYITQTCIDGTGNKLATRRSNDSGSTWSTWQEYGSGSGETNTASNVGTGADVFKQKTGVDLEFRTLIGGTNVTLSENANDITINASGGGSSVFEQWLQAGNLSQVSSTLGNFYKTPKTNENGNNGWSQPIANTSDSYVNGAVDPFVIPEDGSLDEIRLVFTAAAVSTGTVGTPVVRIVFYKVNPTTHTGYTTLGTVDIPISATGVGVWNNLGTASPQNVLYNMTDIAVSAGDLVGWRFVNVQGNDNINSISRPQTSVHFVADS